MTLGSMDEVGFHAVARSLRPCGSAFIDGEYCDSLTGLRYRNHNPATGELINTVAHCSSEDVDRAVKSARIAFEGGHWSRSAPEYRKEVLLRLAGLIRAHARELAVLESIDSGKTITDCLHEVGTEAANFFQWYAELIDKTFAKVAPTGSEHLALIVKEPAGVVGVVLPWNFPLLMAAWKLAPALAAGCSVIVKPAEQTPLTAIYLAKLVREAGVPRGVLSVVPGDGQVTGQAIGRHSDIDVVSFTGSTEVGRCFLRYAGDSNLKSVGLEMGGKSPFIVLDDATITDELVDHAAKSAFWNGGQNCSANMLQLVSRGLVEEFTDRVIRRANEYRLGDPLDPSTEIGSMVSEDHRASVMRYIERGVSEGATLRTGGSVIGGGSSNFISPTVFSGLTRKMSIAREEIFGPVLGVMEIDSLDDAVQTANDSDYGLHATVFTRDIDRAVYLARRLRCGTVSVNGFSEGDIKTPFGGYKRSGSLARDNGTEAMEQYLQTKTIWIQLTPPGG